MHLQIAGLFVLLLGALALALGIAADRGARELVGGAAATTFDASAELVLHDIRQLEGTARGAAEALALSSLSRADTADERRDSLESLAAVMRAVPGVYAAYLGWPNGDFLLLRSATEPHVDFAAPEGAAWLAQWAGSGGARFDFLDPHLVLVESRVRVDFDFDPRTRPWYAQALQGEGTVVTDPYVFFTTREPGITAARRALSGAVAGVDVTLWDLSDRLPAGSPVPSAESAVIDAHGTVLAYAHVERLRALVAAAVAGGNGATLPTAADIGSPVIAALAERAQQSGEPFSGRIQAGGREWLAMIAPLEWQGGAFVMAAPIEELTAGPERIRTRLLQVFGIALLLGVPAIWVGARLVARPVETFAREVEAVAQLDFATKRRSPSRVRELDELDQAIATMRANLGSFTEVCRIIFESDDVAGMLSGALDGLMSASGAESGGIWLADDTGRMLEPMVLKGTRSASAPSVEVGDTRSAAARAAAAGELVVLRNVVEEPDLLPASAVNGGQAILALPLRSRTGEVKGSIVLGRREGAETPFPMAVLALVQTVGRLMTMAIDRRRLIAEQRANLEQLRLLETAVSRLNDIVVITDADSIDEPHGPRLRFVNEAFTRHTGYLPEEALGRTPRMLQGARTSREQLDRIRTALAQGEPVRSELVNYTRTGDEIWLDVDIVPLRDDEGRVTHWVAVERDITGRKLAEEQARISQERFLLLARVTNDVVWDWDVATGRTWWNDRMTSVFGHSPETVGNAPDGLLALVDQEDRERVAERLAAAVAGRQEAWLDEYRLRRGDGRMAVVVERGFAVRGEGGSVQRLLGSMTDVTELRELDERLGQSQKLEAIGQLTGGLAHDFNNILTVITGSMELLHDALSDRKDLLRLTDMTRTAAERGASVTHQLLAFARRQSLRPEAVRVDDLVAAMGIYLRPALGEQITIETEAQAGLWPAFVDPAQLQNALLNLCLNARDAMPSGGNLRILLENKRIDGDAGGRDGDLSPGDYVRVTVADSGIGMTPDLAARAFEPFFTTKDVGKGSGLGLSMVYGFARQSRGQVRLHSDPGRGTRIVLDLPRARDAGATESAAAPVPLPQGGGQHILLVEDDELVRSHVSAQLDGLGYRVTAVADGARALEAVRAGAVFDLLFTDMVMPGGMNGRQLAEAVRDLRPDLPVLFTSGYTDHAFDDAGAGPAAGTATGKVRILTKPYKRADLAAQVRAALADGIGSPRR